MLLVKNDDNTKMEEGEYFAIETFGSTGRGRIVESVSNWKVKAFKFIIYIYMSIGGLFSLCQESGCTKRPPSVS